MSCFYYGVTSGRKPGVYTDWRAAKDQVRGWSGGKMKKFETEEEAEDFVDQFMDGYFYTDNSEPDSEADSDPGSEGADSDGDPDPKNPNTLVAFCDGSALRNGQPDCQAAFACIFPHCRSWDVVEPVRSRRIRPTNNRAEYLAALMAIRRANHEDPNKYEVLYIYSDSMLLIQSMTKWIYGWERNGWCKADGSELMNRDLLQSIQYEQGNRRIIWEYVPAHSGRSDWFSYWNNIADREAWCAARNM